MSKFVLAIVALLVAVDGSAVEETPVRRVVTLLEEMKAQVEKEGEEDKEAYDKYACWCETNDKEKTAAIEVAEKRIDDLTAAIEEGTATIAKLKTEIEKLEEDIAAANKALETATAQRAKEQAEFQADEADKKEALAALAQAIDVLSKVQLVQKKAEGQTPEVGEALIQVRNIVRRGLRHYRDAMQADLWDFLSATGPSDTKFLPKHATLSALSTGDEQPIEGGGAVPGAKSYNSRSGQIFGILQQMHETFGKDLATAQKEELTAMIQFHNLRSAKQEEIDAANKLKDEKSAALAAETQAKAQAEEDLEDTKAAMAADQKFLMELKKNCKIADEEYSARNKVRGDEIIALGEALKILTDESARDLFGRTQKDMSFLQTDSVSSSLTSIKAQNQARTRAVQRIMEAARKSKNWQLATLAVSAQLDAFTKVKEMMDKMVEELKKQQAEEYEKWEFCKKEIDANEDSTKEKTWQKEDLEDNLAELENTIKVLTQDIEKLQEEVAEMQVSLKRSGEDRKAENKAFQAGVADQRAVVNILNKVLARLKMFYEKKDALVQVGRQEPGAAVEAPPPKPKAYEKSAGAGGVMQLIQKIVEDAELEEAELVADEQKSQEAYAGFVQETNNCLAACEASITEKQEAKSTAEGDKSETEAALLAVNAELTKLQELNVGLHQDCDFLLENFEIRQKARKEEIDAIIEAKAILSGADFGR